MKETVESAIDLAIYVVVLMDISRVLFAEKNILSKFMNLNSCDVQGSESCLDTINILKKHHYLGGTDYSVFSIAITGMKTLFFAAFIS